MSVHRLTVECTGIAPLLMNAMSQEQLLALWNKEKAPRNQARPAPEEHCEKVLYLNKAKKPILPGPNLYSALVDAGRFIILDGKTKMSTRKDTTLPAYMTLEGTEYELLDPKTGKEATWEVDIRKGTNPNGGEAVAIVRPRFDEWKFIAEATIDLEEIAETKLRTLFEYAGKRIGLCDFRPARKGPFGQFVVTDWQLQQEGGGKKKKGRAA